MIKKVLSTVLFLISFFLFGQRIVDGEVVDIDGVGISNVIIKIENSDKSVVSDINGKFSIELPEGKSVLTFQAKNYTTFKRSVERGTENISITLKDDTKEISELVISAEKKLEVNKLNIKNLEAPMTTNVLNHVALQKWDINNVEDASKMIAGVNSIKQYGGFQFFNIRGFDNFVILYDGVRDERHTITQSAPVANFANVERMEVLKGPSGEMFGHSALGGIINIIRKKPTYTLHGDAKFTVGSYNTYNATVGVGGPIFNKLRYRIDFGTMNTNGWRGVKEKTGNASINIEYSPDEKNVLEFFYQYNDGNYGADVGVPATNDGKALDWTSPYVNYANPHDYTINKKNEFYVRFKHKINSGATLDYKISYFDDSIDYLMDEVLFLNPENKTYGRRNGVFHFNHVTRPVTNQLDFSFKFQTWKIKHKAIIGNSSTFLDRKTLYGKVTTGQSDTDISAIQPNNLGERRVEINRIRAYKEFVSGFYFQDWIDFSDRFKILLGLRYDYFSGEYDPKSRLLTAPANPDKGSYGNFTYRGAVSFQPVKNFLTTYISASSFFKPIRSYDARTGNLFKPESGFQVEGGVKIEKKNKVNFTLSGFYIEKNNLIVGHMVRTQVGTAISSGLELDADAEITKGLYLKMGYAYTNAYFAKQTPEQGRPDISNNKTPWTPKHSVNTWINYEPQQVKGLGLGLGALYIDKTYQNQFNNQILPAYTVFNGTVYYGAKNGVRIGLNVDNIFNKLYYSNALSNNDLYSNNAADEANQAQFQIYPGKERNYKLSLSYSF